MDAVLWVLLPATFITSAVSGVLGMAGGMMLLAIMSSVLAPSVVVPVHGVVQLASNFSRSVLFIKDVRWKIFFVYAGPLTVGSAIGTLLWRGFEPRWFGIAIGGFILAMLLFRRLEGRIRNPPLWTYVPLGLLVGFLSIFLGATGPLIAPFFLRDDLEKREVIGTKAVCQSVTHLLKLPAFAWLGFDFRPHLPMLLCLLLAVAVGTYTGKKILDRLSNDTFVRLFEIVLVLIALKLLLSGVSELWG